MITQTAKTRYIKFFRKEVGEWVKRVGRKVRVQNFSEEVG